MQQEPKAEELLSLLLSLFFLGCHSSCYWDVSSENERLQKGYVHCNSTLYNVYLTGGRETKCHVTSLIDMFFSYGILSFPPFLCPSLPLFLPLFL